MGRIVALAIFALLGAGAVAVGLWRRRTSARHDKMGDLAEEQRATNMRITKRSSGGRGEYEISEAFGSITPRDILDRTLVIDLNSGVEISTGVRLLLRHGKRRLRIDEKAGCEMHLHRQLAAALMLPYPARDETGWATDVPVMQSGFYGIGNIAFSSVMLVGDGIARIAIASVTVVNRGGSECLDAPSRMANVKQLWERYTELPPHMARLVTEHRQLVETGGPIPLRTEEIIVTLQKATVAYCLAEELPPFSPSHDVLPVLLHLLQPACAVGETETIASQPPPPRYTDTASPVQANGQPAIAATLTIAGALEEAPDCEPSALSGTELEVQTENGQQEARLDTSQTHPTPAPQAPFIAEGATSASGEADTSTVRVPPAPRRYRPQPRGPAVTRRSRSESSTPAQQRDIPVPIDLRLRSRVGGTYVLSFLPRRRAGMPPEAEVIQSGQRVQLSALHENWYQDIVIPEAGANLREGVVWYTEGLDLRWSLAGREVFVLGTRDDLSGFISVPRLVMGARHMVICSERILEQVLEVLRECCEGLPPPFGEHDGLPAGWVGIGPVVPTAPLPPSRTGDILDALRPDPEIVIELEGGIRIQHSQYLVGYPPQVRVYGSSQDRTVLIDGNPAEEADERFTAVGWDSLGDHVVQCGAASRTYTVVEPDDGWESWPAYSFPVRTDRGLKGAPSICGTLVKEEGVASLLVPASMPVLLGARPGQIYVAPVRNDVRLPVALAFPPFAPVWAVPTDPLHANKTASRVLLIQSHAPSPPEQTIRHLQPSRQVLQWSAAILDCCRKGLSIEPADEVTRKLWRSYRELARRLWRLSR